MKILQAPEIGQFAGFGNQCIFYCWARKYAELAGAILEVPNWAGRQVFDLRDPFISDIDPASSIIRVNEPAAPESIPPGVGFLIGFRLYRHQKIFTKEDVRRYLPIQERWKRKPWRVAFHRRHLRGGVPDTEPNNKRPDIAIPVFIREFQRLGLPYLGVRICDDTNPIFENDAPELVRGFLRDFVDLATAENLFVYPCSTFSGMAAYLCLGNVYIAEGDLCNSGANDCTFRLATDADFAAEKPNWI